MHTIMEDFDHFVGFGCLNCAISSFSSSSSARRNYRIGSRIPAFESQVSVSTDDESSSDNNSPSPHIFYSTTDSENFSESSKAEINKSGRYFFY